MDKRWIAWMLTMVLALGLVGCGTKSGTDDAHKEQNEIESQDTDKTEAKDSVTAYVGTSIFEDSLDPIKGGMSHGYPFICNALLRVDPDSQYVGDLAEDWTIGEDGLTYTFTLRQGVKFSDGSDFTAEDVVFTYNEVKANQANNENVDLTRLESVSAKDDHTVEFKLSERYSPFFDTVAQLQIVPSDSYDSRAFDTAPIGTGSWKMLQYDPNQQMILEANEDCFAGAPGLKRVTIVHMDQDAAFAAAQSGQLDIVMVGAGYAGEEVKGMTLVPFETMDVRNISLPVEPLHKVMDADGKEIPAGNDVTCDKAVRKALSIGIDREKIIDDAFNGVGRPAMSFTDDLKWAEPDTQGDKRADEAMALLEEAGWLPGSDGIREKDGVRCTFDVYAPGGDQDRYQLAAALAESARPLGIEIQVKSATWDEVADLQYSAGVVWGWGQYSPTVLNSLFNSELFMKGAFDNVVEYNNEAVDAKLQEALSAADQEEAIALWKEIQRLTREDYPYLYLVNIEHCYFVKDGLDLSLDTQIPHPHGHGSPVICNMKDWKWK